MLHDAPVKKENCYCAGQYVQLILLQSRVFSILVQIGPVINVVLVCTVEVMGNMYKHTIAIFTRTLYFSITMKSNFRPQYQNLTARIISFPFEAYV